MAFFRYETHTKPAISPFIATLAERIGFNPNFLQSLFDNMSTRYFQICNLQDYLYNSRHGLTPALKYDDLKSCWAKGPAGNQEIYNLHTGYQLIKHGKYTIESVKNWSEEERKSHGQRGCTLEWVASNYRTNPPVQHLPHQPIDQYNYPFK